MRCRKFVSHFRDIGNLSAENEESALAYLSLTFERSKLADIGVEIRLNGSKDRKKLREIFAFLAIGDLLGLALLLSRLHVPQLRDLPSAFDTSKICHEFVDVELLGFCRSRFPERPLCVEGLEQAAAFVRSLQALQPHCIQPLEDISVSGGGGEATILAIWEARKDISLDELRADLAEIGLIVSVAGLHRFFARRGMTRKKRLAMPSSRTGPTS